MIRSYYLLIKPGIVKGNLITAAAGFLFASRGDFDFLLLLYTLLGIGFLIASACVFNNYIDRELDAKMTRTKKRALATKEIPAKNALIFGGALGVVSFLIITLFINWTTLGLGLIAFINYLWLYGWTKRNSVHGTLVGTIAGAMPITAGYTAAAGQLDTTALLLFLILVFWQMPHFYAIGIYRSKEYRAAHIPLLPIVKGYAAAKKQMTLYILGFIFLTGYLSTSGRAGTVYLLIVSVVGFWWLFISLKGQQVADDNQWAKKMFSVSLLVLFTFSAMISLDYFLP